LFAGSVDEPLQGKLIETPLDNQHTYTALSYAWGGNVRSKEIRIEGTAFPITPSLEPALLRIRTCIKSANIGTCLWIDSICINQEDESEKSCQVQLMADIYQQATQVLVFLCADLSFHNESVDILCLAVYLLQETSRQSGLERIIQMENSGIMDKKDGWRNLVSFFAMPWFRRTWIIQEYVIAKEVVFFSGQTKINSDYLYVGCRAISALGLDLFSSYRQIPPDVVIAGQGWKSFLALGHTRAEYHNSGEKPSLLNLITRFAESESTLARDRLFAFLGLAGIAYIPELKPDYEESLMSIVCRYAKYYLQQPETQRQMLYACEVRDTLRRFPSWAPDLISPSAKFGLSAFSINRYSASAHKSFTPFDFEQDEANNMLRLRGYRVDRLSWVGKHTWDVENASSLNALLEDAQVLAPVVEKYATSQNLNHLDSEDDAGAQNSPKSMREFVGILLPYVANSYLKHASWASKFLELGKGFTSGTTTLLVNGEIESTIYSNNNNMEQSQSSCRAQSTDDLEQQKNDTFSLMHLRKGALTGTGRFGVVAKLAQEGDFVFIVRGLPVPFLIRCNEEKQNVVQLVGHAFIDGLMFGEAFEKSEPLEELIKVV
jgi:hypothetical protein